MLLQQKLVDSYEMNIFDPKIFIAELFSICPTVHPQHPGSRTTSFNQNPHGSYQKKNDTRKTTNINVTEGSAKGRKLSRIFRILIWPFWSLCQCWPIWSHLGYFLNLLVILILIGDFKIRLLIGLLLSKIIRVKNYNKKWHQFYKTKSRTSA